VLALLIATVAALVPATAAHAEWHLTKGGAEKVTKYFVASHYANMSVANLGTACRPQGRRYNPAFKYHRWVCAWYDGSDNTTGTVLIVGSAGAGRYYGKVLAGARNAS
jgi:hypothetical protein